MAQQVKLRKTNCAGASQMGKSYKLRSPQLQDRPHLLREQPEIAPSLDGAANLFQDGFLRLCVFKLGGRVR